MTDDASMQGTIKRLRAELAEVAAKHGHMTANAMREQARAETAEAQLAEAIADAQARRAQSIENWRSFKQELEARQAAEAQLAEARAALAQTHAFIGIMFGRGPDAIIPETVQTPLGPPVKIGEIMRQADAVLARTQNNQRTTTETKSD